MWSLAIGLLWFLAWTASGSYVAILLSSSKTYALLLPLFVIAWLIVFFFGQAAISRIVSSLGIPLTDEVIYKSEKSTSRLLSDEAGPSITKGIEPSSSEAVRALRFATIGIASKIIVFVVVVIVALIIFGAWRLSHYHFTLIAEDDFKAITVLLRKLGATVLVYFMQFGFIAFEAGSVRHTYRRQSARKNLVVFAISFVSYIFVAWPIQQFLSTKPISTVLDIAFNAGFASTVALIVANTITERGTLLVNGLCAFVAGIAYALMAGLGFNGGVFATKWPFGFVDTAGGSVVHILGGMFGLSAAFFIGPRSNRLSWYLLAKVRTVEERDSIHLAVIGAFFLWFGWLGFNSGNAESWQQYLAAFMNTIIGASIGGLVGLGIAVVTIGALTMTVHSDLFSQNTMHGTAWELVRELANLDRVVLGMMGGLVAVTANASLVRPWQALIEAVIGATVAITGSAVMARYSRHLDDPLGAIATHAFAGTVGVLCTSWFRDECTFLVQAFGCLAAGIIGVVAGFVPCLFLRLMERLRSDNEPWLYGRLLRLTSYDQRTGEIGIGDIRADDIGRALARLRAGPPLKSPDGDRAWVGAVGVLALSEMPNSQLKELFDAVDLVLSTQYTGRPEEQTAIAAIGARADIDRLPLLVSRGFKHIDPQRSTEEYYWSALDIQYRKTLTVIISELAESVAAEFRKLLPNSNAEARRLARVFNDAARLLATIGPKEYTQLRKHPSYGEIKTLAEAA